MLPTLLEIIQIILEMTLNRGYVIPTQAAMASAFGAMVIVKTDQ